MIFLWIQSYSGTLQRPQHSANKLQAARYARQVGEISEIPQPAPLPHKPREGQLVMWQRMALTLMHCWWHV
jgi:hypothetical protein